MTPTLKQLALELRLSTATVSLALRDNPVIARETREKVQALAKKRNYIKSNLGMALQAKKTRIIGYLIDGITKTFYNEVLQGAGNAALDMGYGLLVGWVSKDDDAANLRQVTLMLEKDVDALIVSEHLGLIAPYLDRFESRKKPVVYCTCSAPLPHNSVVSDDFLGGELAVRTLARAGHKNILISKQWEPRYAGNLAAAQAANIATVDYKFPEDVLPLLKKHPDITAIASYADDEACSLMYMLRAAGFRVPEDISIIGFNDQPICTRPEYMLTTVAQQRERLGSQAVNLAVDLIEKRCAAPVNIVLEPSVVLRKTVTQPRKEISL